MSWASTFPHTVYASAFLADGKLYDYYIGEQQKEWITKTIRNDKDAELWRTGSILTVKYEDREVYDHSGHELAFTSLREWLRHFDVHPLSPMAANPDWKQGMQNDPKTVEYKDESEDPIGLEIFVTYRSSQTMVYKYYPTNEGPTISVIKKRIQFQMERKRSDRTTIILPSEDCITYIDASNIVEITHGDLYEEEG